MSNYWVIRCDKLTCGKFSYCKSNQKTKKCPYCERIINLAKVQKHRVHTTGEAKNLVQIFNARLGEITEPKWYKESKTKMDVTKQ